MRLARQSHRASSVRALASVSTSQSKTIEVPAERSRNIPGSRQIISVCPRIQDHIVYQTLTHGEQGLNRQRQGFLVAPRQMCLKQQVDPIAHVLLRRACVILQRELR